MDTSRHSSIKHAASRLAADNRRALSHGEHPITTLALQRSSDRLLLLFAICRPSSASLDLFGNRVLEIGEYLHG
jgi:hypothetical protein